MFIKKNKKNLWFFENVWAKSIDFLVFSENFRKNWLKFLGCPQNFGVLHLKM